MNIADRPRTPRGYRASRSERVRKNMRSWFGRTKSLPCWLAVGAGLAGCGDVLEQTTVTISYAPELQFEDSTPVRGDRSRVEAKFKEFSERNGYKCRSDVKRVQELICRGPDDIRLVFEPSVNKQEFVATFSWANVGGRTHEGFLKQVTTFQQEFAAVFGDTHVRVEKTT